MSTAEPRRPFTADLEQGAGQGPEVAWLDDERRRQIGRLVARSRLPFH
jgi:hypothetical protein